MTFDTDGRKIIVVSPTAPAVTVGAPLMPTVPDTGWVAGRLPTLTVPETGWVASRFANVHGAADRHRAKPFVTTTG